MSLRDDAWALWASLGNLSNDQFKDLSFLIRGHLSDSLRDLLDAAPIQTGLGKLTALQELKAIEMFPVVDAAEALAVWIEVATTQLGDRFVSDFEQRRSALSEPGRDPEVGAGGAERAKVDVRDDLVGIRWLNQGQQASEAVCFITVPRYFAGARNKEVVGTGFLVSQDRQHVMTAFHVVEARDQGDGVACDSDLKRQLAELSVSFDFVTAGLPRSELIGAHLVAFDRILDYAIIRISQPMAAAPLPLFTGSLPKVDGGIGFVANIIQHPMRNSVPQPKQLGLRNNAIWKYDDQKLFYFTDTRAGSSGSPVLSDDWQVFAVHTGWDNVKPVSYMGRNFAFANRGSRMSKVVPHAQQTVAGLQLQIA